MTAKDVCGWCSFGYEQLVQTCMCVILFTVYGVTHERHTSGCSFPLSPVGGVVLQKLRDFFFQIRFFFFIATKNIQRDLHDNTHRKKIKQINMPGVKLQ